MRKRWVDKTSTPWCYVYSTAVHKYNIIYYTSVIRFNSTVIRGNNVMISILTFIPYTHWHAETRSWHFYYVNKFLCTSHQATMQRVKGKHYSASTAEMLFVSCQDRALITYTLRNTECYQLNDQINTATLTRKQTDRALTGLSCDERAQKIGNGKTV